MKEKILKWHKVTDDEGGIAWQPNGMAIVEAAGKKLTLINRNGQLYACAYKCPHASGILADGMLDAAGNLVCPVHRYKFNPANGRNVSGEGYYLKVYVVEQREAGIFIGFEESGWLNFLK